MGRRFGSSDSDLFLIRASLVREREGFIAIHLQRLMKEVVLGVVLGHVVLPVERENIYRGLGGVYRIMFCYATMLLSQLGVL